MSDTDQKREMKNAIAVNPQYLNGIWQQLSDDAKILHVTLQGLNNGSNRISFATEYIARIAYGDQHTKTLGRRFSRGMKELIQFGVIRNNGISKYKTNIYLYEQRPHMLPQNAHLLKYDDEIAGDVGQCMSPPAILSENGTKMSKVGTKMSKNGTKMRDNKEGKNLREEGGGRAHAREAATLPPILEKESEQAAGAALATARGDRQDETPLTNAIEAHHGAKEATKVQTPTNATTNAPTGFDALLALHEADRIPAVSIWHLREAYGEYGDDVIRAYAWGLKNKKERDGLIKYGLSGGSKKTLMEAYHNNCATTHKMTADDETRRVNALYRELDALGGVYFQEYRKTLPNIHYVRANFSQCEKILETLKRIEEDRKNKTDVVRANMGEFSAKMAV